METVMRNERGLALTFGDVFITLLLLTLVFTVLLISLLLLLRGLIFDIAIGFFFSLAVSSYLQVAFMNGAIDFLEGSVIEMSRAEWGLNLAIWALVFCCVYFMRWFKKIWMKGIVFISITLLVMQLAVFVSLVPNIENRERTSDTHYFLSKTDEFVLSSDHNTVVFILDHLSVYILQSAFATYPHLQEMFSDFTRFDNSAPLYVGTFPSIAYLLTNARWCEEISTQMYLTTIWDEPSLETLSFYNALWEAEYRFHLLAEPFWFTAHPNQLEGFVDNLEYGGRSVNQSQLIVEMVNLALFRYSPYRFKNHFRVIDGSFSNTITDESYFIDDIEFYQRLIEKGITVQHDYNMLVIYHLLGQHGHGRWYDEFANPRDAYCGVAQTAGSLWIINEYMEQMKELGIYDNANIIIISDHGEKNEPSAAFMMRRAYVTGEEMQISYAPISHENFWPTLVEVMGLATMDFGESVFEIPEGALRERTVTYFTWHPHFPNSQNTFNTAVLATFTDSVNISHYRLPTWQKLSEDFEELFPHLLIIPIYDYIIFPD